MARKQKSSVLSKFLDLIGIVDTNDEEQGDGYEEDFDNGRNRGRSNSKTSSFNDEFENEPRMSRASGSRRSGFGSSASSSGNPSSQFDADEGWGETNGRPEYGARTQQRAQSKNRASNNRYGSDQRTGSGRTSGRYDNGSENEGYHRSNSSYQGGSDYQNYRSNTGYGSSYNTSYGTNSHRYDEHSYGSSGNASYDQHENENTVGQQRHQTVIFKLRSVNECKGVIMALIEKKSVLLNLDELDSMQAQRTLDTMSGATFAIGAKLSRASDRTWLITPSTVDVNDKQNETNANEYSGRYNA